MNKNIKKIIFFILIFICGCEAKINISDQENVSKKSENFNSRFEFIKIVRSFDGIEGRSVHIIKDNLLGKEYLSITGTGTVELTGGTNK